MIRALRTLRNEPGFALSAVFTLALGIACSSAMFSVFYAVLLAPVPYADPLRVVAIHTRSNTTGRQTIRLSGGDWSDLAASGIFEGLARYHGGEVGVQLHNRAEWAGSYWVSPTFFKVFDAAPVRGRSFTEGDEERAAVVSARFARRVFGDAAAAIGQVVRIDTRAYEVVGVMPADFAVPEKAEIWVASPAQPENHSRTAYNYFTVGRLAPGVTAAAAEQRMAALADQLARQYPENRNKAFAAVPLRDTLVRNVQSTLFLLMGAVMVVLLISCTNVAHLLLARAAGRTREFAIRTALGAGGARIAGQVLAESLTIGLAGGAVGILLAYAGVRATVWLAPAGLPRIAGSDGELERAAVCRRGFVGGKPALRVCTCLGGDAQRCAKGAEGGVGPRGDRRRKGAPAPRPGVLRNRPLLHARPGGGIAGAQYGGTERGPAGLSRGRSCGGLRTLAGEHDAGDARRYALLRPGAARVGTNARRDLHWRRHGTAGGPLWLKRQIRGGRAGHAARSGQPAGGRIPPGEPGLLRDSRDPAGGRPRVQRARSIRRTVCGGGQQLRWRGAVSARRTRSAGRSCAASIRSDG